MSALNPVVSMCGDGSPRESAAGPALHQASVTAVCLLNSAMGIRHALNVEKHTLRAFGLLPVT